MALSPDTRPPGLAGNLGAFLRAELAPYPGRLDAVIRFGVCITLVILLTVFLQLPFLDLGIIVIFFTVMPRYSTMKIAELRAMASRHSATACMRASVGICISPPSQKKISRNRDVPGDHDHPLQEEPGRHMLRDLGGLSRFERSKAHPLSPVPNKACVL